MLQERDLILRIQQMAGRTKNKAVIRSIGDDCAVLRITPGFELLVTTDFCIENVHFRRNWHPSEVVGHRCLTRGLSDIAAMGGEPLACFLSLGLPSKLPQSWVNGFLRGLTNLAKRFRVQLAGGDISSAQQITADIIVTGQAPAGKALLRSGARPGDRIFVTGALGGSAAVLQQLFGGKKIRVSKASPHFYPTPRIAVAQWLRTRGLATSMIDLSDGLSVDLSHLCKESCVSALIKAGSIPVGKNANLELALHGGEDYELLFTAPKSAKVPPRVAGVSVTEIGEIQNHANYSPAIQILGENGKIKPLPQRGWQHFS
ncbi:MAG TPA: thiamine-phosphate kinase, partial [Candidatus Angelobacter sp.]|nr:thiamine-phosphate kinase [Candidatus Angelobacter sp.]